MTRILTTLTVLLLTPLSAFCAGELKLAAMFSDHMILQRDRPVPVWGWSDAGAEVTVDCAGQTRTAVADASGRWMVNLCPMPAGYAFRAIFVNPHMTAAHVDELLDHLQRCASSDVEGR
jgi:hypothetical protein